MGGSTLHDTDERSESEDVGECKEISEASDEEEYFIATYSDIDYAKAIRHAKRAARLHSNTRKGKVKVLRPIAEDENLISHKAHTKIF